MKPEELWTLGRPRLHMADWGGGGTPMLLLHGMGGNVHWWDAPAPALAASHRVAALDFSGHGDSAWREDGGYSLRGFTEDVEAARLALGWDRFLLVGHSMGALVALLYAAARPERVLAAAAVDFLIAFPRSETRKFERIRRRPQPYYDSEESVLARFRLEPPGTTLDEAGLGRLARLCARRTEKGWTWRFDWRAFQSRYDPIEPELRRIRVPVLVVKGELSTTMPPEVYERVLGLIPECRGVVIGGSHHHAPLDAPEALTRVLLDFASAYQSTPESSKCSSSVWRLMAALALKLAGR